jgi:hypothetical protein
MIILNALTVHSRFPSYILRAQRLANVAVVETVMSMRYSMDPPLPCGRGMDTTASVKSWPVGSAVARCPYTLLQRGSMTVWIPVLFRSERMTPTVHAETLAFPWNDVWEIFAGYFGCDRAVARICVYI